MFLNPLKHWQHQLWWCRTEMNWVCLWREQAGSACLERGKRDRVDAGKSLHCCPTPKCWNVFTLWQRTSKLTQEHQNVLPVLYFPLGLLGLKVRSPSNIPWAANWQLKLVQTVLSHESGLLCRASTRTVTRTVSWNAAATAATRESRGGHQQAAHEGFLVGHLGHHHFGNHRVTARWSLRIVLLNSSQWGCRIKASFWQSVQRVMEKILWYWQWSIKVAPNLQQ